MSQPLGVSNHRKPTRARCATPACPLACFSSIRKTLSACGDFFRWPMASVAASWSRLPSSLASESSLSTHRGSPSSPSACTARTRWLWSSRYSMPDSRTCIPSARPPRASASAAKNCVTGFLCLTAFKSGSAGAPRLRKRKPYAWIAESRSCTFGLVQSVAKTTSTSLPSDHRAG